MHLVCQECANVIEGDHHVNLPCPRCGATGSYHGPEHAEAAASPESLLAATNPVAPATTKPYGGFWLRFVAALLDSLILLLPCLFLIFVFSPISRSSNEALVTAGETVLELLFLFISWLYFALQQSGPRQATIGKAAMRVKVTDLQGQRISFARATGRYFAAILSYMILFIGFFMIGWTERKQGLHDMIAGTLVRKEESWA
ncbi:MAG: RDD family protein [Thermoplasmatota archaeon]